MLWLQYSMSYSSRCVTSCGVLAVYCVRSLRKRDTGARTDLGRHDLDQLIQKAKLANNVVHRRAAPAHQTLQQLHSDETKHYSVVC